MSIQPENATALPREFTLGRFVLHAPLGANHAPDVIRYAGQDTRTAESVCVTIVALPDEQTEAEQRAQAERFEQGLSAFLRLTRPPRVHPHLAPVREVGLFAATPLGMVHYFVSPPVFGETLADRLHRGPFAPTEAAQIALQIADALDALHGEGIVHCAVTPQSVWFADTKSRTAVLGDFGLYCPNDATQAVGAERLARTQAPYLSPEQTSGQAATPASDIWALGIVLYEMLTGTPPFGGSDNTAQTLYNIAYGHTQPVPGLSPVAEQVMVRALERDPERRYATATALARAFRSAIGETAPVLAPVITPPAPKPVPAVAPAVRLASAQPTRRSGAGAWWIGAGAVAAAGLVFGIWQGSRTATQTNTPPVASDVPSEASETSEQQGVVTSNESEPMAQVRPAQPAITAPVAPSIAPKVAPLITPPGPKPPRPPVSVTSVTEVRPALPTTSVASPRPSVSVTRPSVVATPPLVGYVDPAIVQSKPSVRGNRPITVAEAPAPRPTPFVRPSVRQVTPSPEPVAPRSVPPVAVAPPLVDTAPTISAPVATPAPEVEGETLTFKGTWKGNYHGFPAILTVNKQNDEAGTFAGTITFQAQNGPVTVDVTGRLRDDTGEPVIELREKRIADQPSGSRRKPTQSTGTFTPSGGMRGTGAHPWYFGRE